MKLEKCYQLNLKQNKKCIWKYSVVSYLEFQAKGKYVKLYNPVYVNASSAWDKDDSVYYLFNETKEK